MKFPIEAKIEKVVSREKTRPVLARLHLRIVERITGRGRSKRVHRDGYLEATDSYKLVSIPVELDSDDVEGFIPIEAITRARKEKLEQIAAGTGVRVGDVVFDRPIEGTYPDVPRLLPADDAFVFAVGVNASFLNEIADAFASSTVRLEFPGTVIRTPAGTFKGVQLSPNKPIRVRPLAGPVPEAKGILMPTKLADPIQHGDNKPADRPKRKT